MSGAMIPVSSGSGFIVREDGLIVTNAHVVGNQTQVVVRLFDGRTMEGKVQAVDTVSDLATIKVNAVRYLSLYKPGVEMVILSSKTHF
jgi:HtrA serine peptidase 2